MSFEANGTFSYDTTFCDGTLCDGCGLKGLSGTELGLARLHVAGVLRRRTPRLVQETFANDPYTPYDWQQQAGVDVHDPAAVDANTQSAITIASGNCPNTPLS